jgi:hypothetical protein
MPASQYLQWIRSLSAVVLSLRLLAACGVSDSPQTATAYSNTYNGDRPEASLDDGCAPLRSPVVSAIGWMNCVGAALGSPPNGEAGDSTSVRYASTISRRPKTASSAHADDEKSLRGPR